MNRNVKKNLLILFDEIQDFINERAQKYNTKEMSAMLITIGVNIAKKYAPDQEEARLFIQEMVKVAWEETNAT